MKKIRAETAGFSRPTSNQLQVMDTLPWQVGLLGFGMSDEISRNFLSYGNPCYYNSSFLLLVAMASNLIAMAST